MGLRADDENYFSRRIIEDDPVKNKDTNISEDFRKALLPILNQEWTRLPPTPAM